MNKYIIGLTDCSKFDLYRDWVLSYRKDIEVVKLGYKQNNLADIAQCDGILLSGGEDVHPKFYHQPAYLDYCYPDDVDEQRDIFEFEVLSYTETHQIPVLGICRGIQVANVYFGGNLIPDIATWGKFNHAKMPDKSDRYHEIIIDPNSFLYQVVKTEKGMVNSNHHQSPNRLGKGLVAAAHSADGVIEAIERADIKAQSFLLLVQWHPERLHQAHEPFSKNLHEAFMDAVIAKKT